MSNLFRVGTLATDTPGDVISLKAHSTTTMYDCLEYPGTTNYQVPVGKTLYVCKVIAAAWTLQSSFNLGYGDNALDNAAGPPTNWVQCSGGLFLSAVYTSYIFDILFSVPAQKYLHIKNVSSFTCDIHIQGVVV